MRWRSRKDRERGLDRELRDHLELEAQEQRGAGLDAVQARYAARRSFGNINLIREDTREMWGWMSLERLGQDLRFGARLLRRNLVFTLVAVSTLALGIGANTAIFQLLNAVLLQSLPVHSPHELVDIHLSDADRDLTRGSHSSQFPAFTNPIWEKLRGNHEPFSGVAAWGEDAFSLDSGGDARYINGLWVSGDLFRVLGVKPLQGRLISAADDRPGCGAPGVVISYQFWQREFGGEPVLGRTLDLNDRPVEIIGITPASFFGLNVGRSFDAAVPVCSQPSLQGFNRLASNTNWWLAVIARLAPTSSLDQAAAYLQSISAGIFATTAGPDYPRESVKDYLAFKLRTAPASSGMSVLRERYSRPLRFLLAIAGIVLLITCANLANLILARSGTRGREMAVRLAIGADRMRLLRQLLAETLLLSTGGAIAGTLLAQALSRTLVSFLGTKDDPVFVNLQLDWRVFGFLAAVSVATCLLCGLAPAWKSSSAAPAAAMNSSGRGNSSHGAALGLRAALVVSQVALSLVLLFGALLFAGSLRNLMRDKLGFQPAGVLAANFNLSRLHLPSERETRLRHALVERLRAIPGVSSVAEASIVPLSGMGWGNDVWNEDGPSRQRHGIQLSSLGPGYFGTLGIPLLSGRDFNDRDIPESPRVAIVNEEFVRVLAPGPNPLGARFRRQATPDDPEQVFRIVGIVANTKYSDIHRGFTPIAYTAITQEGQGSRILLRSTLPLPDTTAAIRRVVHEMSPVISFDFQSMDAMIARSLVPEQLMATLSGFFGGLAVLLAMIGLYGVVAYTTGQRTNEIGIRVALGARPGDVTRMILHKAAQLVGAGLLAGTVLSLLAGKAVTSLLFGLMPHDPAILAVAVGTLAAFALIASWVPARRAAMLAPTTALRQE